ncbi:hypothetical protein GCM10022226_81260 [Sphaerisporangium flaviroseum]|uniref:Uncharacterized protein n=1 Tax=Sphaerisporangium flaviroseum TaxID=509199 RepID=A0ABP7JK86_9ACTN
MVGAGAASAVLRTVRRVVRRGRVSTVPSADSAVAVFAEVIVVPVIALFAVVFTVLLLRAFLAGLPAPDPDSVSVARFTPASVSSRRIERPLAGLIRADENASRSSTRER